MALNSDVWIKEAASFQWHSFAFMHTTYWTRCHLTTLSHNLTPLLRVFTTTLTQLLSYHNVELACSLNAAGWMSGCYCSAGDNIYLLIFTYISTYRSCAHMVLHTCLLLFSWPTARYFLKPPENLTTFLCYLIKVDMRALVTVFRHFQLSVLHFS